MLKSRLLGAVGIVAVVGGVLAAQTPEGPKFEVASLRLAPPGSLAAYMGPFGQNRWTVGCIHLNWLVAFAFEANQNEIEGLPSWNNSECYSVAAKAEDGVLLTREELRPRLKQLLEERFHLSGHIEVTNVSAYGLVLAKGGPKLKEATTPPAMIILGIGRMRAASGTMDQFASTLGSIAVEQPVVNETGLTGNYDFTLTYAPEGATDSTLPSIFTALEEQLGLKLEGGRKLPHNRVVIDHVERPTED